MSKHENPRKEVKVNAKVKVTQNGMHHSATPYFGFLPQNM